MFILWVMVKKYRRSNLAKWRRHELLDKGCTERCMCAIGTIIGSIKTPISIMNTALFSALPEFADVVQQP